MEKPFFVPENMKYDKYSSASIIDMTLPYPVFFADKNGDSSPDMFVVKDKIFDSKQQKYEYKVLYAENGLDLSTGTLITIACTYNNCSSNSKIIVLVLAIL